jgi:uncharacterized protein (DUF169 family)
MGPGSRYADLATELTEKLQLELPPVALAYVTEPPAGVPESSDEVPSSCTFWRRGERQVLYASARQHFNCAVGAMTQGFDLPESVQQELGGAVQLMGGSGYVGGDEPPHIPVVDRKPSGIVYGPLADFPLAPDLVLMWLTPAQGMLFGETLGQVRWSDGSPMAVYGRPTCAALPVALKSGRPAISMGCLGMRTYTEIGADRFLAVVPGEALDEFGSSLLQVAAANRAMGDYYDAQKAKYPVGGAG